MAERIDELQLLIGSDASKAIEQLGSLASALDTAASSTRKLAGATGFLSSFCAGLSRIANTNLDRTISNLERLSRLDLSNLKDKNVTLAFQVKGASEAERFKYATEDAEKSIRKSAGSMAKSLGNAFHVDPEGVKELTEQVKDYISAFANKDTHAANEAMQRMFQTIYKNGRMSVAELQGVAKEYQATYDALMSGKYNANKLSQSEISDLFAKGFGNNLRKGAAGIDQNWSEVTEEAGNSLERYGEQAVTTADQLRAVADETQRLREALEPKEFSKLNNPDLEAGILESIEGLGDNIQKTLREKTAAGMRESLNKIPIDLDIDQNRFENQIQKAIDKATGRTYTSQPIKLKLDNQQLRENVEAAFSLIDLPKLPQFAEGFASISASISTLNQTNMKDTGLNQFTNSIRRLVSTDTSKFDVKTFESIAASIKDIAGIGDVGKGLNGFVSSIARLANAGEKTGQTAEGMKRLTPEIKTAVKTFIELGTIDAALTSFIASLSRLATAGKKTDETASGLSNLSQAVMEFLNALSGAPEINENIANTIQGLGNLAAAGASAGKAMNSVMNGGSGGGNGFAKTAVDTFIRSYTNGLKGLLNIALKLGGQGAAALGNFLGKLNLIPTSANSIDRTALSFSNLLRAILPFYGLRGMFEWGKEALNAGSSIVELENVIDTSFGKLKKGYEDISGYIYKWAETTIDAFGVSQIAAERYAGRLMAMFNSSGFDITEGMRDSAAKMSTDLIERAGDIASFYDISVDEAMTKMQAGLAGMTRPLRSLGINMSVANMQAFALSRGITTAWKEMDQATQMALRYEYMLHATQYAAGDFQKTSMSLANELRLLQLNFQVLSTTIGQGLVSAIAPVIGWLNLLIRRLIQAAAAFRTFMWTLFGKPLQASKGVVDDMAGYLDDASGAADGLAGGAGDASDGLGKAGKAAKNLKKQLQVLPFDELNQLAKDTEAAGSGGSGGAGGGGGGGGLGAMNLLGDLDTNFDLSGSSTLNAINKWAEKIKRAFLDRDWKSLGKNIANFINMGFGKLYEILDWKNVGPKVYGFVRPFQQTFNSIMEYIDWDLIGRTFGRGLNTIVYTLRTWITGFNWRMYGTQIATGLNSMLDEWDADAFGRLIADKFKAAWDFFGGFVKKFDFKKFGKKLKDMINGAIEELNWSDMGETLAEFFNGVNDAIIEFFSDGTVIENLKEAFVTFVNSFLKKFDADKAKEAFNTVKDELKRGLAEAIEGIDKTKLKESFITLLEGLPWGTIADAIGAVAGAKLAIGIFGKAFELKAISLLSGMNLGGALGGAGGAAGAGAGGAAAGAGGAAAGGAASGLGSTLFGVGSAVTLLVGVMKKFEKISDDWAKSKGVTETASDKVKNRKMFTDDYDADVTSGAPATPIDTGVNAPLSQTVTLSAKVDPSFTTALASKWQLEKNPTVQKLLTAEQADAYKKARKSFIEWHDDKVEKRVNAKFNNAYHTVHDNWNRWDSETIKKTVNAGPNGAYNTTHSNWDRWVSETIKKTANGGTNGAYTKTHTAWTNWVSETVKKTANGGETDEFKQAKKDYDSMVEKWVPIHLDIKIKDRIDKIMAEHNGTTQTLYKILYNASGGLFDNTTAFQVFGEAGAEAAIPLERRSTMRKIANAIVDSGGMQTSSNTGLATEIAAAVAPYIMDAVSDANSRPVQVNATLYTENNEVLARAVHQGQKSIDKRYNPVSQFSY